MENGAEARMAGRTGAALFAGAGAITLINSVATSAIGAEGVDVALLRVLGFASLLSAVAMWFAPWARVHPFGRLVPAAWGLALLLCSGHFAGYAGTDQAATAFPVFFVLILTWLGLTQPRGVPLAFAGVITLGCLWLFATTPNARVSVSGMLLAVGAASLVGETVAFVTERNRRHTRELAALVSASSELRDVLTFDEGTQRVAAAIQTILGATRVTFSPSSAEPDATAGEDRQRQRDRCVSVALRGPSGVLGIAVAHGVKVDVFTDHLIRLMSTDLGGQLEQLRLLEALGEQSFSDALTGVGNRRRADALTADLSPGDAVLLIDLDNFKDINDNHGHRAGDRVLEELGRHLKSAVREEDAVARYGGDEFVVRLNPKDGNPEDIARRLLTSWLESGALVSFSVGIAVHGTDVRPETTFALADGALYEAKSAGRGRVCSASSSISAR